MKRTAILAASAVFALSANAIANGRYPAASQLVVDPNDPQHLIVSATFGLLESRDGGKTFGWMCEAAIGTSGQQDMMLAVTGASTTVVAMLNGVATTQDGCSYRFVPELDNKVMGDLALRRSAPHELVAFWLDFRADGKFASQIVRSDDDGQKWAPFGPPLPPELLPLTLDVAPSNASRVYVSARTDRSDNFASVLLRSDDGGATFETTDIPGSEEQRLAYIAAVHPVLSDRIYVRVNDEIATVLLSSGDGGRTFQKIMTGSGQLLGFSVSPDGTQIAVGGPADGIWIGAADGTNLARRSDVGPSCLTWATEALYACADFKTSGFSLGRSLDSGATFESLLRFDTVCGRAACDRVNTAKCSEEWSLIAPEIGMTCSADAGLGDGDSGGSGVDGGKMDRSDASGKVPTPPPSDDAGSGCTIARFAGRANPLRSWPWFAVLAVIRLMGSSSSRRSRL